MSLSSQIPSPDSHSCSERSVRDDDAVLGTAEPGVKACYTWPRGRELTALRGRYRAGSTSAGRANGGTGSATGTQAGTGSGAARGTGTEAGTGRTRREQRTGEGTPEAAPLRGLERELRRTLTERQVAAAGTSRATGPPLRPRGALPSRQPPGLTRLQTLMPAAVQPQPLSQMELLMQSKTARQLRTSQQGRGRARTLQQLLLSALQLQSQPWPTAMPER